MTGGAGDVATGVVPLGGATVVFDGTHAPTTHVPADCWKQADGGQE